MATLARAASEPIEPAGSKGLCIATRCANVDEFIAKFQACCDETSMFVATPGTRAIGHASPFIILLADKTPVMRGTCTVLEAWTDGDNPFGRPGIRIALEQLTDSSQKIFDRLLGKKPVEVHRPTMIGFPVLRVPAAPDPGPQPVQDGPTERMSQPPAGVVELGLARPLPPLPPPSAPLEIDVESSNGVKRTKGMRITTPCKSVDEFMDRFRTFCEPSSFFIATKSIRPIGLDTAFSIDLADGKPMLRGQCTVLEAWPTGANRFRRPGMLIALKQLTPESRAVVDRLLAAAKPAADAIEAKPLVVIDRQTRPMVALGSAGERFAVPAIKPIAKPQPPARLAIATPPAAAPVAPPAPAPVPVPAPAASVDSDWSSPVEAAEAPSLPLPPEPEIPIATHAAAPVEAAPISPVAPVPLVIVAPELHAVTEVHATPIALPAAPPSVAIAARRPRRLAFAITFAAGIALGAIVGFTARPALAPTPAPTVAAAPAPVAMPPAAAPITTPVATPPAPPPQQAVQADRTPARTPDVRPPAHAPAVKRPPAKHVVRPAKRPAACTNLSCL